MQNNQTLVLNATQIDQKVNRIAYQIFEDNADEKEIIIAGVSHNGHYMAQKLVKILTKITSLKIQLIEVVINKENPIGSDVKLSIDTKELTDKVIIVVDDVLNSGKTLIYGLHPFLTIPIKKLRTAVLVDRNHKRYPIAADFVGLSMATTLQEHISVDLSEGNEAVFLS
jgi:pyrimidine operon attenuation protein/uracil phosphoribosyltransferase